MGVVSVGSDQSQGRGGGGGGVEDYRSIFTTPPPPLHCVFLFAPDSQVIVLHVMHL